MKTRIFSFLLVFLLLLPLAVSCGQKESNSPLKVLTLNGTTGFGMAKLMHDNTETNLYDFWVREDASDLTAALISGDADIAALPTNAAAAVYQKTNGGVTVLAINTFGCLYLLNATGKEITSFADLNGETVYTPAQNPAFITKHIADGNGSTVTIDSSTYAKPAALKDAVAAGTVKLAILPEPMATMAIASGKQNGITIVKSLDLNKEWNDLEGENHLLVQGCIVVRNEILNKRQEEVWQFLIDYKNSVQYVNNHISETAKLVVEQKLFANEAVAEKAIPYCNIGYLDGESMKVAMQNYLSVLLGINPQSIGGSLPEDDFYFNPLTK